MNLDMTGIASNVIAMLIFAAITSALRYGWTRLKAHAKPSDATETAAMTNKIFKNWQRTLIGAVVSWFCLLQLRGFAVSSEPVTRSDIATAALWAAFFVAFFLATLFRPTDE